MSPPLRNAVLHAVILVFVALTLLPFVLTINNSFRSINEIQTSFFGVPRAFTGMAQAAAALARGSGARFEVYDLQQQKQALEPAAAFNHFLLAATRGYRIAWESMRPYFLNSMIMVTAVVVGTVISASATAYVLSRYRFFGSKFLFYYVIAAIMFPGVLTFVPSFMLVRELGMLNSYAVLIIPLIGGGQVFGIYIFKTFFDGLPEDLFEAARIDGAGHLQIYFNVVVPLSKPVISVVIITTAFGAWNNFLWPFVTITDSKMHPVASGLYIMATSAVAQNPSTLFAAYVISSVPLLILFTYATKPFIEGMTSGAFKA